MSFIHSITIIHLVLTLFISNYKRISRLEFGAIQILSNSAMTLDFVELPISNMTNKLSSFVPLDQKKRICSKSCHWKQTLDTLSKPTSCPSFSISFPQFKFILSHITPWRYNISLLNHSQFFKWNVSAMRKGFCVSIHLCILSTKTPSHTFLLDEWLTGL